MCFLQLGNAVLSSIDKESFIDMLKGGGKAQKHRPQSRGEEKVMWYLGTDVL